MPGKPLRQRVWEVVEVAQGEDRLSRAFDIFLMATIFVAVTAAIFSTVKQYHDAYLPLFRGIEYFTVTVFTIEYLLRLWSCPTDPRFADPVLGRLRFVFTPIALIDLLAIVPFFLLFWNADLLYLRSLRLFQLFRIAKLTRYFDSLQMIGRVVRDRAEQLLISLGILAVLLILAAALIYQIEGKSQPEAFPDIPTAMWWAVVTLTTVGYGDVYPVSQLGRFLGACIAVMGIALFALPTAILGAGFMDELERKRRREQAEETHGPACFHCGKALTPDEVEEIYAKYLATQGTMPHQPQRDTLREKV
ncbi:MAG: ion transporter [Armatimonadaceae bacterium]